jgi:hypothetical protein
MQQSAPRHDVPQPDPSSSSDGDGSWTEDPITQDPDEDRSVDHVIAQTHGDPPKSDDEDAM